MVRIDKIFAEEIFDSRGNPTIKVTVTAGTTEGSFAVPSGASTGIHEAMELRDDDVNYHNGKGVFKAIDNVNKIIAPELVGKDASNQSEIDSILLKLDGTENKRRLGANALIGVSIATAKTAGAVGSGEVFEYLRSLKEIRPSGKSPYLYMNLINGGKHANNGLAFQEYHIVPITSDTALALDIGLKIQQTLKEIIMDNLGDGSVILGDEGGFAPKISDVRTPLQFLKTAIERNNLGTEVRLALDTAGSSFYENGLYNVDSKQISKDGLMDIYKSLIKEFNLISIEDPFHEEDFEGFRELKEFDENLLIVGDDLTVTNIFRLKLAIDKKSVNAMIIKPNQIGTLSETLDTMKMARDNDINLIVSHRSGETEDDFIADLAYAFGCFGLKSGAPQKPERRVKYDRLRDINR